MGLREGQGGPWCRKASRRLGSGRLVLLFLLWVGLLQAGCGYRSALSGEGVPLPSTTRSEGQRVTLLTDAVEPRTVKRLAVVALRNDSPEPWLDRVVTDAFRREFDRRGSFQLVDDPRDADLVLRGRIRPIEPVADSFSSFIAALEYAVRLELDLELLRSGGQLVRLDTRPLSERESYFASPDIEVTRTNRLEAFRRLSDLLASRVADALELMERPMERAPSSGRAEGEG